MCLEKFCGRMGEMHRNPINCFLHVIAAIVIVYGLWQHSIELILIGFLIAVVGHIIQAVGEKKTGKKTGKKIKKIKSKKAALELSIGTIVVIVIAITMLILGIVFVRSVMCGALGLTGEINSRVKGEINKLFGSTGGEVQCIGATGEPVRMVPGKVNIVYCGIKAPQKAKYSVELVDYKGVSSKSEIKSWIVDDTWQGEVAPGDEIPKKIVRLNLPNNAPEGALILQVIVKKEGNLISTQELDFEISRVGLFRAAMC